MSVQEIYDQAKQLSADDREKLFALLLGDITPNPPNSIRSKAHLEELLLEGLNSGPGTPLTGQDWQDIREEVRRRVSTRKGKVEARL